MAEPPTRVECVTIEVLQSDATYTSVFWRFGPDRSLGVSSKQAGEVIDLGEVPPGELILGIVVNETGLTFKTGDGSRNPDDRVHARIEGSEIWFEDTLGGGDGDFNDAVLRVTRGPC